MKIYAIWSLNIIVSLFFFVLLSVHNNEIDFGWLNSTFQAILVTLIFKNEDV